MAEVKSPAVTRKTFSMLDLVTRADPDRDKPEVVYDFSKGRKFKQIRKEYT